VLRAKLKIFAPVVLTHLFSKELIVLLIVMMDSLINLVFVSNVQPSVFHAQTILFAILALKDSLLLMVAAFWDAKTVYIYQVVNVLPVYQLAKRAQVHLNVSAVQVVHS
jgi:hypothetical protein